MRLGTQEIQYLNVFQSVSRAHAKDCLIGPSTVSFVVKEGQMGLTIGKDGSNVKRLRQLLKKNVELFEHKETAEAFLNHAFSEISFGEVTIQEKEEKKILVAKINSENRRKLLNDMGKMKRVKEIVKRNYGIFDIKIEK